MRICLDLDGVIAEIRKETSTYSDVVPVEGAVEKIRDLRKAGHVVIIYTARHMKTSKGNVGLVLANQGLTTLEWLARHGIEFDEIYFEKPFADVYVDDNAFRFTSWSLIDSSGANLPRSSEEILLSHSLQSDL
jgi:capsule biosynthesis phosphatase